MFHYSIRVTNTRFAWLFSALLLLLLSACTTSPPPPPKITNIGQPIQVESYVGNPTAKPYARRTLTDIIGAKAPSLIEYIGSENNILEFKNPALAKQLDNKWLDARTKGFTIAHFGDSLVQGGYAAEIARGRLQIISGSAGRGMVFPYAIAKTYSQNDFKSSFTGDWTTANSIQPTPRLPLGISGFVARTSSQDASFTLNFSAMPESGAKRIKLFYAVNAGNYTLKLQSGHLLQEVALTQGAAQSKTQMIELNFPVLADSLRFDIRNSQTNKDDYFEIHGMSIENDKTGGIIYHNFGVGGATYGALLAQSYFEEQSTKISPDLVVLDWGTNDIVFKNSIAPNLESTITQTIRKVRMQHPNALIILTSAQDLNFRKRNITAAGDLSKLIKKIAFENDCFFYDWYRVAGGAGAMSTWVAYGLGADNIHLTGAGYAIKGELFAQSILNTLMFYKKDPSASLLELSVSSKNNMHSVASWLKEQSPVPRKDLFRKTP